MSKESYTPSERRFEVSKDLHSRERIKRLMEVCRGLREKFPGIHFAFSLFGSLSKGKELSSSNADTDIDLRIFFDSDDTLKLRDSLLEVNTDFKNCYEKARSHCGGKEDWEGAPSEYEIFVVNETMIDILQSFISERLKNLVDPEIVTPIRLEGPDSILSFLQAYELKKSLALRVEIARYFHLDVGGGLKRYHQHFLWQLSQMDPKQGESYWQVVNECVRDIERYNKIPEFA